MVFLSSNVLVTFLLTLFVSSSSYVSAIPTLSKRGSRTSPPYGAIVVKPSGAAYGEFTSVQAAVNSLPNDMSPCTIFIYAGTYEEQVTVSRPGPLTMCGETTDTSSYSSNSVTITHSESAGEAGNDQATATLIVNSPDFKLYNVNLKNTFGHTPENGQALALSAGATRQGFYACGFYSYQDTVLTESGVQYYGKCYIEGAVDFIFGQHGHAFFQKNTIASIGPGSITANGPNNSTGGIFVINDSDIILSPNAAADTSGRVYLGRPWTETARVIYSSSNLGSHINPLGWTQWSIASPNTEDVLFGEYHNRGPGASGTRASFTTKLSTKAGYTIKDILGSDYKSWVDMHYL